MKGGGSWKRPLMELLRQQEAARQKPATNDKLARVLEAWHACPPDLTSHERAFVLTGFSGTDYLVQEELKAAFRELKRRFESVPFGPECHKALEAAQSWSDLVDFARTTRGLHAERIQRQVVFREADDQAVGRVAIHRADKELALDNPQWLEERSPTLQRIAHVRRRYLAYQKARELALNHLDRLLYPPALLKKYGVERGELVHWLRRAYGVPRPPNDIPRFVFIARTEALRLCSQERFDDFCKSDLPKLSREDRQRFYELALRPAPGKDSNLVPFVCWWVDNGPVFTRFRWTQEHVCEEAERLGIARPKTPEAMDDLRHAHRIHLRLPKGLFPREEARRRRSLPLVTPAPSFTSLVVAAKQARAKAADARRRQRHHA
jgi:hypothetical protein